MDTDLFVHISKLEPLKSSPTACVQHVVLKKRKLVLVQNVGSEPVRHMLATVALGLPVPMMLE